MAKHQFTWTLDSATLEGNAEILAASGSLPRRIRNDFAFDSSAFGTIVADWDAAQLTGLIDGQTVTSWTDFSGQLRPLDTQVGTPTYETNEINGLPVVRFNGSSSLFRTDAVYDLAAAIHVFIVWKTTTANSGNDYIFSSPQNLINNGRDLFMTGGSAIRSIMRTEVAAGDTGAQGSGFNDGVARITEIRLNPADATLDQKLIQNGVVLDERTVAGTTLSTNPVDQISIAQRHSTSGDFWTGDIGRIIAYTTLTTAEALSVRTALGTIYGITLP
jgi:hypothetical protein